MGSAERVSARIVFGEFELDVRTRELWCKGTALDLQEQPFQVLCMLLERQGELVTREELTQQLWPAGTFVDFEHSLNRVINRLREALKDSAEYPRFVETLPRRGYRFIAPVRQESSAPAVSPETSDSDCEGQIVSAEDQADQQKTGQSKKFRESLTWHQRLAFVGVAVVLGCLAGVFSYWLLLPAPSIRITAIHPLTSFGRVDPWLRMVSDGARIFYLEREGDHWNLKVTSTSGDAPQNVPTPFRNTAVLGISPDRSNLLIASFMVRGERMPFWIWPVQGGAPKRVGEVQGYTAIWNSDGRSILYSDDGGIYQVDLDGSHVRKFVSTERGHAGWFAWSPDGRRFTYTVYTGMSQASVWRVDADGKHLERFDPGWGGDPQECCASWSADGEYFYFASGHMKIGDIWAVREKENSFHFRRRLPTRLTAGPGQFTSPLSSSSGRQVLAYGLSGRGELARYDFVRHELIPTMPSISALSVTLSPDGRDVAYESSQDWTLARTGIDGSQPRVLTPAGMRTTGPSWSPDGKFVAFQAIKPNQGWGVFLVSSEGGAPVELAPNSHNQGNPAWSPDGKVIAFDRFASGTPDELKSPILYLLDPAKNESLPLAGGDGMWHPSWSPNGRFIAASSEDRTRLMLFDVQKQRWLELARVSFLTDAITWSKNSGTIYFQDLLGPNQPIYRIKLADGKKEFVTDFENPLHSGIQRVALVAMMPDDSLLIRLDRGGADIYALDVERH